jgi:hypothetical protein
VADRLSQAILEALEAGQGKGRLSQESLEALEVLLTVPPPHLSQIALEVLTAVPAAVLSDVLLTQLAVESLEANTANGALLTQLAAEAARIKDAYVLLTQEAIEILIPARRPVRFDCQIV